MHATATVGGVRTNRGDSELDRYVAAHLSAMAFIEIRAVAGRHRRKPGGSPEEDLERIRFLANLCHNLPGVSRRSERSPSRVGAPLSSFEQAMDVRPMTWTWNTSGPEGQAWILNHLKGSDWTPPPPLPESRSRPLPMTLRQRAGALLGRWPVRAPQGHAPLPAAAHVLKALDTAAVCALYEEAGRLRLGLGSGGPWLPAHLGPDAVHYVVPDPASYYWPGNPNGKDGRIDWWQCRALLRMRDGEQVSGGLAVMPETFAALPSTVPRRQQVRLVHVARSIEKDTGQWGRGHEDECGPDRCGYEPAER